MSVAAAPKALLVDDNPGNLVALEAMLKDLELTLVTARSGQEALRRVLEHEFAVILLDVQMPAMDGFETAARIRERERSQDTPIIFVTAIGRDEVQVFRGYSVGAVDYLFKPVPPEILRAKVGVFLELYRKTCQVQRQADQLETMNQELEAFSYSVSHDLRAPVRRINGSSQILLEGWGDRLDADGREWLQRIRDEGGRMSELIDGLLDLSRVTSSEIRRDRVDLSATARAIASDLGQSESEREVEVVIAEGLQVSGDERLLRNLMENLLSNAWKFTDKTPRAKIEFGVLPPGNGAAEGAGAECGETPEHVAAGTPSTYFVRDNGAGFDMRHAERLFTPFQRLHSLTEFNGTGVGLATVQRIVNRHGGRIWAEAEPGRGATFFFTL